MENAQHLTSPGTTQVLDTSVGSLQRTEPSETLFQFHTSTKVGCTQKREAGRWCTHQGPLLPQRNEEQGLTRLRRPAASFRGHLQRQAVVPTPQEDSLQTRRVWNLRTAASDAKETAPWHFYQHGALSVRRQSPRPAPAAPGLPPGPHSQTPRAGPAPKARLRPHKQPPCQQSPCR